MSETEALIAQAKASVTGPDTPNEISVSKPDKFTWVNRVAVPAAIICVIVLVIVLLAWGLDFKIWTQASELIRAHYVGAMGVALCIMLGVVVFSITGNKVGRIEVKMGPGQFSMGGDNDAQH